MGSSSRAMLAVGGALGFLSGGLALVLLTGGSYAASAYLLPPVLAIGGLLLPWARRDDSASLQPTMVLRLFGLAGSAISGVVLLGVAAYFVSSVLAVS